MQLKYNYFLAFFLSVLSISCNNNVYVQKDTLKAAELVEDFQLFRQALEEAHPGLYTYTGKESFDKAFDSVRNILMRGMSKQEFYQLLTPLVTYIRCGHTKFMVGGVEDHRYPFNSDQLFPLRLLVAPEGAFVEYSFSDQSIPPGSRLLRVNGQAMGEIIDELLRFVTFADGMALSSKYLELSNHFAGYYAAFLKSKPVYSVHFLSPDGKIDSMNVKAVNLAAIKEYENAHSALIGIKPLELDFKDNTAIITVRTFWFEDKATNFEKFLKDSFQEIRQRKIQSLIIDLRDNEGGKDSYGALLFSYLTNQSFDYYKQIRTNTDKKFSFSDHAELPWYFGAYRQLIAKNEEGQFIWKRHDNLKKQQPQDDAYQGDVYVLINGRSFSVTSEFAAVAFSNGRATFIGQETGGGYKGNNSGFFAIVTLPHSGFTLGIPLWRYEMAVEHTNENTGGVKPHFQVSRNIQDKLNGKDREMQTALDLIRSKY